MGGNEGGINVNVSPLMDTVLPATGVSSTGVTVMTGAEKVTVRGTGWTEERRGV